MNSFSVLQHLASNPQLVGQLQSLLTLIAPSQDGVGNSTTATTAEGSSFTTISSSVNEQAGTSPPPLATSLPSAHTQPNQNQHKQRRQQQGVVGEVDHLSTQTMPTTRSTRIDDGVGSQKQLGIADVVSRDGVSLQHYEQLAGRCRHLEVQLEQTKREAAESALRAGQLENEVRCLTQRVEQLVAVVEEQKRKLDDGEAMHQLETAEMKNNQELALQSYAAAYEKTIQQVLSAQRLIVTARKYEEVVGGTNSRGAGRLLSATLTPINRGPKPQAGSSAKRYAVTPHEESNNNTDNVLHTRAVLVKHERDDTISSSPIPRNKRRTPRTPSVTAADRVVVTAASKPLTVSSLSKMSFQSAKAENDSPHARPTEIFKGRVEGYHTVSPGPATSTITEAMARHHHLQQHQQQQQQQQGVTERGVESKFVAQYGATALPPTAPTLSLTPPSTRLAAVSQTPWKRGQYDNINSSHLHHQNSNNDRNVRIGQRSGTSSVVGGPTRSPSPVNPKRGKEETRRFVLTSLSEEERGRVRAAVTALGQKAVVIDSEYEDPPPFTATHIVVRGPPRSMKALCGVVGTKWLVQPDYIYASHDAGFWLDEYEEGGLRCFPPPLMCQRFLLTMPDGIVKEKLEQVIEYGGGEVVRGTRDGKSHDQGVVVIASGDDLLRFATRME